MLDFVASFALVFCFAAVILGMVLLPKLPPPPPEEDVISAPPPAPKIRRGRGRDRAGT